MKVVIVNPPARARVYGALSPLAAIEPPVWAGIMGAYLTRKGYPSEVLDCEAEGLTIEESAARLAGADLAVFMVYGQQPSASTQCLPAAEAVAKLSGVRTICVGTHPSALPERTLREGPWTYVCQGEGPLTVLGLLHALDGMGRTLDVPGLWYWDGDKPRGNPPAPVMDCEELADHGLYYFDFNRYRAHNWASFGYKDRSPYASLQTSLGCPWRCSFCCINAPFGASGIRFWSPENVLYRFSYLADLGVIHVKIPDEMFVLKPAHVEAICDGLIKMPHRFNIWAYARVDTVKDDKLLAKMKRAGFNWLGVGVESASKHVRDGVDKGRFGNADIVSAVRRVQSHGINVGANYIFGLPDDNHFSMQATLDLACELNTEWANFYCAMAYPGSALHKLATAKGWALPDPNWIAYSQHAYETLPLPTEHVTAADVLRFRDAAFMHYFTRPEYLSMMRAKFGAGCVAQIEEMTATKLERKICLSAAR